MNTDDALNELIQKAYEQEAARQMSYLNRTGRRNRQHYLIRVGFPPPASQFWTRGPSGGLKRSEEAEQYIAGLAYAVAEAGASIIERPLIVCVEMVSGLTQIDWMESLELLIRSLSGIAFDDEASIVEMHLKRRRRADYPEQIYVEFKEV
jgi:hypothetical protein